MSDWGERTWMQGIHTQESVSLLCGRCREVLLPSFREHNEPIMVVNRVVTINGVVVHDCRMPMRESDCLLKIVTDTQLQRDRDEWAAMERALR